MITKNKNALISVIIPVYNNEKYIEKCLDSIINQTYKNIEIIIINDCSIDNVEEIILKYKKQDNRIVYLKNKANLGVGNTRNRGIDVSKGNYIYFLDSDDYIKENCIEELYKGILTGACFSCITKGYKNIDGESTLFSRGEEEMMLLQSPSVCIRLFNKKVLIDSKIKFSNLKIGEDLEFVFKLLIYNNKVAFVNKPLYTYVIHNDSSIMTFNNNQLDTIKALEQVEKYAKENKKYEQFYDILEFASVSHILIGTVRRIKLCQNYNEKDIQKCFDTVNRKYPNWKSNAYVKKYLSRNIDL